MDTGASASPLLAGKKMVKNAVMTHCPRIARDNYTPLRPSRHPLIVRIVSVPEDPSYVAVGRDPRPSLYIPFAHLLPPSPLFPLIYRLPLIFQFCPPISSLSSRFRERATDRSSSHQIIAKISRGGATTRLPRAHSGNVQQVGVSSAHAALPTQLATFFFHRFRVARVSKRLLVYEHREEGARFTFLRASGSNFEGSNETGGRGGGGGINR